MEVKIINYENKKWHYYVNYRQQKHMYLKIKAQKIIISAPLFIDNQIIEKFVLANLPKIIKQLTKIKNSKPLLSLNKTTPYLYYLNQKLPITFKNAKQTTLFIDNNNLLICTPLLIENNNHKETLLKKIIIFLRKKAFVIFQTRAQYWAKIMKVNYKTLRVRTMKRKWGICIPSNGEIKLNYQLIHFAYREIDYVIIHELSHLVHSNHSKAFWNFVSWFCPSFQESRKVLQNNILDLNDDNN